LFSFNKTTEHVQNLGGLFVCRKTKIPPMCAIGIRRRLPRSTAEMWYFQRKKAEKLYAFSVGGKQLRRLDIGTRTSISRPPWTSLSSGRRLPCERSRHHPTAFE